MLMPSCDSPHGKGTLSAKWNLQAGVVTFSGNRQVLPRFMLFLNSEGAEQVE